MVQHSTPFNDFTDVSPDDSDDLPLFKTRGLVTGAIYIGGTGDLVVVLKDNTTQTFTGVTAGMFLPLAARRINATNTTASALVACYVI